MSSSLTASSTGYLEAMDFPTNGLSSHLLMTEPNKSRRKPKLQLNAYRMKLSASALRAKETGFRCSLISIETFGFTPGILPVDSLKNLRISAVRVVRRDTLGYPLVAEIGP
jgi:hypothetical protein